MVAPGEVVTARDWSNVEDKRFVVRELFVSDRWGQVAWVTEHVLGDRGVPMSHVIPIDRMTVDAEATEERRRWLQDPSEPPEFSQVEEREGEE